MTTPGDDPELVRSRMVSPEAVLRGHVNLDRYPHRHLMLGKVMTRTSRLLLPQLLQAADLLADNGWELVNVMRMDDALTVAIMRRRDPSGGG